MSEFDDLESRLRALGSEPVDPALQSRHLTAMAAVHWRRSRLGRAKVVGAFVAGIVLGGTGLASAGAMGPTVQNTVADAAAKVNLNLPGGTPRQGGAECTGYVANSTHGQYVRSADTKEERQRRAKTDCGKPAQAGSGGEGNEASECKPPWAGQMDKATRTSLRESGWTRPSTCANEGAEIESESDEEKGKKPESPPGQDGKDGAGKPDDVGTAQVDAPTTTTTEATTTTTAADTSPTPTLPGQANDQAGANSPLGDSTTTTTTAG